MLALLVLAVTLISGAVLAFFVPYWLAEKNLFWTIVEETQSKQVMYMGKFDKSLLVKKGYTFDDEWKVVSLPPGSPEGKKSGLYWVGIPPFFKVYERTMKFVKALSDGTYEKRADPKTDFLLTATSYQYALLFSNAEDKDKLPLSGQMTMTAMIINPYKALFLVRDWFEALESRVLPRVREYISRYTYDELINSPGVDLDAHVFEMLGLPKPNGDPSILHILEEEYGIKLLALETVNIDPPKEYREATLRQFNATQNAKAEAEEAGGALDRMVNRRLEGIAIRMGFVDSYGNINHTQLRNHLIANPGILEKTEADQLDLLRRKRAGSGLRDVRVANADGSKLDPATATLMALMEVWKNGGGNSTETNSGNSGDTTNSSSASNSNKKKNGGKKPKPSSRDDDDEDDQGISSVPPY